MPELTDQELQALNDRATAGDSAAAALEKSQQDLEAARTEGVTATLEAMRAANPDLPPDSIAGATIADIKASVAQARTVADHVKASAPPTTTTTPPPPGQTSAAPPRTEAQPPAGLSGVRLISYALSHPQSDS